MDALKGLFNSQPTIARQYDNGEMVRALGFDWMADQTVLLHTTGAYATSPAYTDGLGFACTTVSGAAQTGSTLAVAALAGPLAKGDIIRIAGVLMVNPVTKAPTGRARTFTVTAAVASGATAIPIYPAITGVDGGGNSVQYQTVNASPANAAQVYVVSAPGSQYRKNLAFVKEAITLAAVDLELPPNVDAAREVFDDISRPHRDPIRDHVGPAHHPPRHAFGQCVPQAGMGRLRARRSVRRHHAAAIRFRRIPQVGHAARRCPPRGADGGTGGGCDGCPRACRPTGTASRRSGGPAPACP